MPDIIITDNNTICIFTIAINFENNKTQFGVGVTSIKWFILAVALRCIKIPAKRKVNKFINKLNVVPGICNICQVTGYVSVPKN